MSAFKVGDFIHHRMKGYGFVVRGPVRNEVHGYQTYKVWHDQSSSNPRTDTVRFMTAADREPTVAELVAYTAWRLTQ